MRIYVGNLSFNTTQDTIEAEFGKFGSVTEVHVPTDRMSGRPRGFAFVTMDSAEDGQKAIDGLNGVDLDGRTLNVNEARPREEGGGNRGGGGGHRGGGGGHRGGGGGGGRDRGGW
ncbi:MAG: RNA-binding protein [Phycisphaera sp.]|nr:RNA-binding protein [Phycisphaera sp.]